MFVQEKAYCLQQWIEILLMLDLDKYRIGLSDRLRTSSCNTSVFTAPTGAVASWHFGGERQPDRWLVRA